MSVLGWFAGVSAPRAVFLALSSGPWFAAPCPLWTRRALYWQWHVQGWVLHNAWSSVIHDLRQSTDWQNFRFFYVNRWITDPEVDS